MSLEAVDSLLAHVGSTVNREAGGYMIGRVMRLEGQYCLHILDSVPAKEVSSSHVSLQFQPKSALPVLEKIRNYEQRGMRGILGVGYYHSHPFNSNFVQPSSTDENTILTNFRDFYYASMIIDPLSGSWDIFVIQDSRIVSIKNNCFFVPKSYSDFGAIT
jgi:proteasome lid subunit RPN8/RPN11